MELLGAELQSIKAPPVHVLPSMSETKLHTHTEQPAKVQLAYFNPRVYRQQVGRPKTLNQMAAHIP